jgi:serine O-acetyltransferase
MHASVPRQGLYQLLQEDLRVQKVERPNPLTMITHLRRAGFSAVLLYRLASSCMRGGVIGKAFAIFISRFNLMINGCDVSAQARVGGGFMMPHPTGVVIGVATIGEHVTVQQNVTLGIRHGGVDENDPANYPVVGNNVNVSAGAVVIGHVSIGDNAMIGANAVVLQDVPAGATAVGVPARVIDKN